jgi:hypothetical protein
MTVAQSYLSTNAFLSSIPRQERCMVVCCTGLCLGTGCVLLKASLRRVYCVRAAVVTDNATRTRLLPAHADLTQHTPHAGLLLYLPVRRLGMLRA